MPCDIFAEPLQENLFCSLKKDFIPQNKHFLIRINMKFLIIQKIKREVPIEKWAKLLPLQFKYFENLEKEKTLEVYLPPNRATRQHAHS